MKQNMNMPRICLHAVCFLSIFSYSRAWDNDELEVFDVVEEVNQNFYTMLNVPQVGINNRLLIKYPPVGIMISSN